MDTVVSSNANATTIVQLFNAIDELLTGDKFATANKWKRVYTTYGSITVSDGTTQSVYTDVDSDQLSSVIYEGVGSGDEKIYFGMKLKMPNRTDEFGTIVFNGYAGYDVALNSWVDQPGAITKFSLHTSLPSYPCVNNTAYTYWVTATTKRLIIVTKTATQYMTGYFGFFTPIAVEKQYPYPMILAGTAYNEDVRWNGNISSATDPISSGYNGGGTFTDVIPAVTQTSLMTTMKYRKVDGTWGAGYNNNGASRFGELCVFPTNTESTEMFTVYNDPAAGIAKDSHVLIPFLLYSNFPCNLIGKLDGIYWIGGARDIASEDLITIDGKTYIIFSNILQRGGNDYYAVEWS